VNTEIADILNCISAISNSKYSTQSEEDQVARVKIVTKLTKIFVGAMTVALKDSKSFIEPVVEEYSKSYDEIKAMLDLIEDFKQAKRPS
jgi:hypothetical protein